MSINDLFESEWVLPLLLIASLIFFIAIPFVVSKQEKSYYGQSNSNNNEKKVNAKIIDKRTETNYLTQSITINFVVFEADDGSRIEMAVRNASTMVVGDQGVLTYNGKQFISFERNNYVEN